METGVVKKGFRAKFIGDRAFYKMVLAIAIPIMVQNGITNFVSLLDNIMVGQVGTAQMSGAAIVNQLIFVFNLCLFGGVSGAGIFTAQYFGQGNQEGVRQTFRYKFWLGAFLTVATIVLFLTQGDTLIHIYLQGEGTAEEVAATLHYGRQYMGIMLFGLAPFMLGQVYASTLRECGETVIPMKAGVAAVIVNLIFNYILIYGKFGFPALGVQGAAIATVLSRYLEVLIIMIWTHRHKDRIPFAKGLFRTLKVPGRLILKITVKGTPLLLNEAFWGLGVAMLVQCYSVRGLNVVAGLNISNTINNVFNIAFMALGDSVAIVVGQLLGNGDMKKARDTDNKMIFFTVACCLGFAVVLFFLAPFFPEMYKTNAQAKELAQYFIMISAIFMPNNAFLHAAYFTLRSGGKTVITFLFDSVYMWAGSVLIAYVLSRYTSLPVIAIFALVQAADIVKSLIGFILVKKGIWLQNFVSEG